MNVGIYMIPMYCDCVDCIDCVTLSSYRAIKFLVPILQRFCCYGGRLLTFNRLYQALKMYSLCIAGTQADLSLRWAHIPTYTLCCMSALLLVSQHIEVKLITWFGTCQKAEIDNHIVRLTFLNQASFPMNTKMLI